MAAVALPAVTQRLRRGVLTHALMRKGADVRGLSRGRSLYVLDACYVSRAGVTRLTARRPLQPVSSRLLRWMIRARHCAFLSITPADCAGVIRETFPVGSTGWLALLPRHCSRGASRRERLLPIFTTWNRGGIRHSMFNISNSSSRMKQWLGTCKVAAIPDRCSEHRV